MTEKIMGSWIFASNILLENGNKMRKGVDGQSPNIVCSNIENLV